MASTLVNGRQFYYTQPGRAPGGRGLMLIHGAGGSHLDWPREIQRLPGLNVYNIDLPGHGRSEGGGYRDIAAYARDVDAFARTLDLDDICVAGHSMGGAIAQQLALLRPRWLSSVILIGTGAHLPVSPQILEALQTGSQDAVEKIMSFAWRGASDAAMIEQARGAMSAAGSETLYHSFMACNQFDVRASLAEMALPVLVISGGEDRMTPASYGRDLAAGIPGAQLLILEGAGHYVTLEQPQAVAAAMSAFVGSGSTGQDKT